MQRENVENYEEEMDFGEFIANVYRGVNHIRVGVWLLVILEAAKFVIW